MTYRGTVVVCIGCWKARHVRHDPWRGHLEGCAVATAEDAALAMRLLRRGS